MAIICPKCGREFLGQRDTCPVCGCATVDDSGIDNSEAARKQRLQKLQEQKLRRAMAQTEQPQMQEESTEYKLEKTQNNAPKAERKCPKCGGQNLIYQREQIGGIGASTNKAVIQKPKKSKGCLYWLLIGFWLEPMYWIFIGWWWRLLFGGGSHGGVNFNANKTMNQTVAICQKCGHTWKIS